MFSICGWPPRVVASQSHRASYKQTHLDLLSQQKCTSSTDNSYRAVDPAVSKAYCKLPICDPTHLCHIVCRENCFFITSCEPATSNLLLFLIAISQFCLFFPFFIAAVIFKLCYCLSENSLFFFPLLICHLRGVLRVACRSYPFT